MVGNSHSFFLSIKNFINSRKTDILKNGKNERSQYISFRRYHNKTENIDNNKCWEQPIFFLTKQNVTILILISLLLLIIFKRNSKGVLKNKLSLVID